ncbi:uncharacterized protein TNCV_944461 [Trichonephila clavipes]|nr:uncharacterized protein TNCV_944461 [Trichonephila clavipes]
MVHFSSTHHLAAHPIIKTPKDPCVIVNILPIGMWPHTISSLQSWHETCKRTESAFPTESNGAGLFVARDKTIARMRVSESFHLPWSHILELSRQAPYLMDSNLHQDLLKIWHQRSKNTTLDEQHCVERILGRDSVRSTDLMKLIGILHKLSDPISKE